MPTRASRYFQNTVIIKLEKTLSVHPNERDILEALVSLHAERGESLKANKYAERLPELAGK